MENNPYKSNLQWTPPPSYEAAKAAAGEWNAQGSGDWDLSVALDKARADTQARFDAASGLLNLKKAAAEHPEPAKRTQAAGIVEEFNSLEVFVDDLIGQRNQLAISLHSLAEYVEAKPNETQLANACVQAKSMCTHVLQFMTPYNVQNHVVLAGWKNIVGDGSLRRLGAGAAKRMIELIKVSVSLIQSNHRTQEDLRIAGQQALNQRDAAVRLLNKLVSGSQESDYTEALRWLEQNNFRAADTKPVAPALKGKSKLIKVLNFVCLPSGANGGLRPHEISNSEANTNPVPIFEMSSRDVDGVLDKIAKHFAARVQIDSSGKNKEQHWVFHTSLFAQV